MLKLKDISTISSGTTFRARIESSTSSNIKVIQMKDLGKDNIVYLDQTIRVADIKPRPNQLAKRGDIIFRSRGQTNTGAILQEDTQDIVVVSAPLFRIRPNTNKVFPEFLLWWINQESSQHYLASRSSGTMGKMVSKQVLEDLTVTLPALAQQQKIAEFFSLSIQEQYLLEAIKNQHALHTQGILMQMAKELRLTASN